ncbi:MAG: hypothetical protein DMD52_10810 [Gemmatimonadetes bacterium]|nr:MAG: hypothetical protein DMD52_10810 [Gemmatimonadota bacterium]
MTRRGGLLGVVLALAVSRCESPSGPSSHGLSLQLSNAGAGDRAMLFQIAGADSTARIDTVLAPTGSSYRVFAQRQSGVRWRVIVTGNLSNGILVTMLVPDRSPATAYSGTILDVADASYADVQPGSRALTITP